MPDPQKRKKPPAFRHYPADRAKKLKKEWVERAKIKSRWKAQKRREGMVSLRSGKGEEEEQRQDHDKESEGSGHSDSNSASEMSVEHPGTASGNSFDDSDESSPLSPPPRSPNRRPKPNQQGNRSLPHHNNKTGSARNYATTSSRDDKQASVRDLFQKAYSKSSLHTYKSDPFKRGRNHQQNQKRGGSMSNTRGGGSNNVPSRGRGQPNMKLRMNAMLAKITEQTKAQ